MCIRDRNRSAHIALLEYEDGEKRYIIAPEGLKVGDTVMSGANADKMCIRDRIWERSRWER